MKSHVLLLQHRDVTENNDLGKMQLFHWLINSSYSCISMRGSHMFNPSSLPHAYNTAITKVKHKTGFEQRKNTPPLTLIGDVWDIYLNIWL